MITDIINKDMFVKQLSKQIHEALLAAAEPIIEKAIDDTRKEMRKRLGAMVTGMLQDSYSIDRMGTDLRIIVSLKDPK